MSIYYIDGTFVSAAEAVLPVSDLAVLRGYGVFDFMRTYGGRPFQLEAHVKRLKNSAQLIGLSCPWSPQEIKDIVEETLKRIDGCSRVLDVGTGSGAIAVALAHEKPEINVTAIDCSEETLEVARGNAQLNRVAERVACLIGDLNSLPLGPFDMIVSNPPYISSRDWEQLMPEVRDHEPRLALDGGDDGLEAYRRIAVQAIQILSPGGWLLVEVGIGQAAVVNALFRAAGLTAVEQRDDYAGIPRVVMGQNKL